MAACDSYCIVLLDKVRGRLNQVHFSLSGHCLLSSESMGIFRRQVKILRKQGDPLKAKDILLLFLQKQRCIFLQYYTLIRKSVSIHHKYGCLHFNSCSASHEWPPAPLPGVGLAQTVHVSFIVIGAILATGVVGILLFCIIKNSKCVG